MQCEQTKTTLYLGRNIDSTATGQGFVSDRELAEFLKVVVTPEFPGFTVQHAQGYWQGEPEPVAIITVLYGGAESARAKLHQIAQAYRIQFHQEAVGIEHTACHWGLV